jgi:anti-sigma factor RsiW
MSRHLSSPEVSQWMIGERTPQQEQHVRQCPECAAELARMEAALALFRGSVRHWSDGQSRAEPPAVGSILRARGSRALSAALGAAGRDATGSGGRPGLSECAG